MKSDGTPQQVSTNRPANDKSGVRLPHERDESDDSQQSGPREDMKQAHADIASGQVDTDLHGHRGVEAVENGSSAGSNASSGASKAPPA
ncbi:MAG: hypothetical protein ACRYGK_19275 [Janthinobacterium lividum]